MKARTKDLINYLNSLKGQQYQSMRDEIIQRLMEYDELKEEYGHSK